MASTRTAILRVFGLGNAPPTVTIYRSNFQRLSFSTTVPTLRITTPVPTFQPTTNPKLDYFLATLRTDYFIPMRLLQQDYRLMFRKQNHSRLLSDPVTVKIDGEPFKLTPKPDFPGLSYEKFQEALSLMKDPSDYNVIPELIRGFSQTKTHRPLPLSKLEKMARHLNVAGRTDIIMQVARNAKNIGFLFARSTAMEFMRALRKQQLGAPTKKVATSYLLHATELLEIVGKREICFDKDKRLSEDNVVLGTLLSMYADHALKYNNGEDSGGNIKEYVLKLKSVWTGPELRVLVDYEDKSNLKSAILAVFFAKKEVRDWTPVLEGVLQAKRILADSALSPWLEETSESLAGNIAQWGDHIERNSSLIWVRGASKND